MEWIAGAAAPIELTVPDGALWVFGYGSLMWDPGFPYDWRADATLEGWHRAFCVQSAGHRGTPEWPGLVVGLAQGGRCHGVLLRAEAEHKAATLAYLWQREMVLADGYVPAFVEIAAQDHGTVTALTFVADPTHESYAGDLAPAIAAQRIATARGRRGPNREYFERTMAHLAELGIDDPALRQVAAAVAAAKIR